MLSITEGAAEAIRRMQASSASDAAGVRIFTAPQSVNAGSAGMQIEVADQPEDADEVIEKDGARIYVAPAASSALADKLLEVRTGPDGHDVLAVVDR
jgi:Fe-S cluster assembly iron-binding protein IscA